MEKAIFCKKENQKVNLVDEGNIPYLVVQENKEMLWEWEIRWL